MSGSETNDFEIGHSFVPDRAPIVEAGEASGDAGAAAHVDALAEATGRRLRSALEEPVPEMTREERDAQHAFDNAFFEFCEHQLGSLPKSFQEMRTTINSEFLDKPAKYEVFSRQLFASMARFGIVRSGGGRDRHTGADTHWMMRLYNFLEAAKTYFGDTMKEEDFDYFLRKYIGELALSFYIEDPRDVLSMAKFFDERMEKIKEIARIPPAQVAAFEEQAKIAISKILGRHITPDFYTQPRITGGTPKETIMYMAKKYGIDLPTEQEFWTKEARKLVTEVETLVRAIEADQDKDFVKTRMQENETRITAIKDALRAAHGKFRDDIFPEEARPFEDWAEKISTRIDAAKTHNLDHLYQQREDELTAALEGLLESLNASEARRIFRLFDDFLKENLRDDKRREPLLDKLREYIKRIDERIAVLTEEITHDASKAKVNGQKIHILGDLREILVEKIG